MGEGGSPKANRVRAGNDRYTTHMVPVRFSARVITGSGRGKTLRVPTLNLDLRDVPDQIPDGVFACRVFLPSPSPTLSGAKGRRGGGAGGGGFPASMHKGNRPTFNDTPSCEVHVLDQVIGNPPKSLEVEVVQFLRRISTFPSAEALSTQMLEDNRQARDILSA